jgi:hypothetical protein
MFVIKTIAQRKPQAGNLGCCPHCESFQIIYEEEDKEKKPGKEADVCFGITFHDAMVVDIFFRCFQTAKLFDKLRQQFCESDTIDELLQRQMRVLLQIEQCASALSPHANVPPTFRALFHRDQSAGDRGQFFSSGLNRLKIEDNIPAKFRENLNKIVDMQQPASFNACPLHMQKER